MSEPAGTTQGAHAALLAAVEALVACGSSRQLLAQCEALLAGHAALPARLLLADPTTETFYPAAGFGGPAGDDEVPFASDAWPPHHFPLRNGADPVGLLGVAAAADVSGVEAVATVLGPCVVAIQQHEAAVGELQQMHEQMSHLVAAGQLLRNFDLEVLLVEILQATMRSVDAQVGAVLTPAAEAGLSIEVTWGLREDHVRAIRFADGTPVGEHVFASGEHVRFDADDVAEHLDCSQLDGALTGLLALPLVTAERKQGVILLGNPEREFTPESQRLAETVCDLASIAIDNAQLVKGMVERERLGRELDIARRVQVDMFPERPLISPSVRVHGSVCSCDETGGDYYTYLQRDGRTVAMIADVTGHGLGAALFTTVAHAMIQHQLRAGADLLPALEAINQGLVLTHSGRFMTAFLAEVDSATGRCSYYSAGHNPILWIHGDEVRWIESIGMPLGIMERYLAAEGQQEVQLAPGDLLVLYTDGFIETINHERECWGEDRFAEHVQRGLAVGLRDRDLLEHIYGGVEAWAGGTDPEDDLTLLVLEYLGPEAATDAG